MKHIKIAAFSIILIMVLLSFFSCYPPGLDEPNPKPPNPPQEETDESVRLNQYSKVMAVHDEISLTATIRKYGEPIDGTIRWESSNNNIASVNNGAVTAQGVGYAVISAISESSGAGAVFHAYVRDLKISVPTDDASGRFDIVKGEKLQLVAILVDEKGLRENINNANITWSIISGPGFVTNQTEDTQGGILTLLETGNNGDKITVRAQHKTNTELYTEEIINVDMVSSVINIKGEDESYINTRTMAVNDTYQLEAEVLDANGEVVPNAVTWKSSDVNLATVDSDGTITTKTTLGTVTITASTATLKKDFIVQIKRLEISIPTDDASETFDIVKGENLQIVAILVGAGDTHEHVSNAEITWTENGSYADISPEGILTLSDVGTGGDIIQVKAVYKDNAKLSAVKDITVETSATVINIKGGDGSYINTRTMATNDTYQLSVEVLDGNGVPIENAVTWKSSNVNLATVDSDGTITTKTTLGTVTITALTATLKKDFIVQIKKLEISVPTDDASKTFDIVKGENLQIVAILVGAGDTHEHVSNAEITWTENGSYADLTPAGILTLSSVGNNGDTIQVKAVYQDNEKMSAFKDITVETSATVINIKGEDESYINTRTMAVNDTYQLEAEVLDENGEAVPNAVTWKSSDVNLATVDSDGTITTNNTLGTVTITALTATLKKDFIVQIKRLEISIPTDDASKTFDIVKGENLQIVAILVGAGDTHEHVSNAEITWTENGSYADISPEGILTLSDVGTGGDIIQVKAVYKDNAKLSAVKDITVETSATVINIKGGDGSYINTRTMATNDTYQLSVEVLDGNGVPIENAVTWKSSDESLATVSGGMITTGNTLGTVTITASTATLEKDFIVHIKQLEISVPSGTFDIVKGENLQLVAVLVGEGNNREQVSNADITWTENGSYTDLSPAGILTLSDVGNNGDTIRVDAIYKNNTALTAFTNITVETSATVINIKGEDGYDTNTRTMAVNDTYQLSVEVLDGNGEAVPNAVTWKSSDESLATVSGGMITTGNTLGTVTITASTATLEKDFIVHIKQLEISVPSGTFDIVKGENLQLVAVLVGEGNNREQVSNADVSWTETGSYADLSSAGILTLSETGMSGDKIQVNAVYKNNPALTAIKDITVETSATVINIKGDNGSYLDTRTMAVNDTYQLSVEVLDGNGDAVPNAVTWKSSDESLATVSGGTITTNSTLGTVTITASTATLEKDFIVHIKRLEINVPSDDASGTFDIVYGENLELEAVLVGEGNSREQVSNADITWTENYSSAEISTAGILTLTDTGTIGDPITVNAVYKNNTKLTASKDIRVETAASVINILGSVDDDTFVNADTRTMAANDTYYLQAEVLDKNGTEIPASTLRWTSNNTAVATVDPVTGKITTSSSFGIVTITASIGDVQKDFTVEVLGLRILPEGNLSMFTVLGLGKHVYLTAEKFDGSIWSSATEVEWDILNESGLNIINGPTVVDGEVSADGIAYIGVVTVVASIPGTNVKAEADISVTAALSF